MLKLDRLTEKELTSLQNDNSEKEQYLKRRVFPDIIIHKRGRNDENLCVIEVKKTTNKQSFDYDKLKLEAYTSSYNENELKYDVGVFISLKTGEDFKKESQIKYKINVFKAGEMLKEQ